MKIAFVTTNFSRWKGDYRVPFIIDAVRAVQNQGNEVRVITLHQPGSHTHEFIDGVEVFRVKYLPEKWEVLQQDAAGIPSAWQKGLLYKLALLPFFFNLCLGVAKFAKGCDIIHANWTLAGFAAYVTKVFHRCPYVLTVHGSDIFKTVSNPILRLPVKMALHHASKIIAVSNALAEAAGSIGVPMSQIDVIPTGIDIRKFPLNSTAERQNVILYVGSLIERKGVIYLIQAMNEVRKVYPDYQLHIIGEGILREELESAVKEWALEDTVKFLGPRPQREVSDFMQDAKLFILPSLEEGQGVVLVEAMASGTPCLGSNIGGIPGVITNEVGVVFEPANSDAIFQAIQKILDDEQFWKSASSHARSRAEKYYDWAILAERIVSIYNEVLHTAENLSHQQGIVRK